MWERWLADVIVILHLGFVLFVIFGGLLCFKWPLLAWMHLPALVWGVTVEINGWICPLTPLENELRRRAGEGGYGGGFVEHYIMPVLYPPGLDVKWQWSLGIALAAGNLIVYGLLWRRACRRSSPLSR
jgi:hypothetical protein